MTAAIPARLQGRRPLDAYYTPDALALACIAALTCDAPSVVVEPSVGGGAFARAVRGRWPGAFIEGVDLDRDAPGLQDCDHHQIENWLEVERFARVDLVVGNPPYNDALAHIQAAIECAPVVGMLLRLGFLAGQKRRTFWNAHPPAQVHVLSRRPSFTGGGTDASEYAWFVWDRLTVRDGPRCQPPGLQWLDWGPT